MSDDYSDPYNKRTIRINTLNKNNESNTDSAVKSAESNKNKMGKDKFCPFMSNHPGFTLRLCQRELCQLWIDNTNTCGMVKV